MPVKEQPKKTEKDSKAAAGEVAEAPTTGTAASTPTVATAPTTPLDRTKGGSNSAQAQFTSLGLKVNLLVPASVAAYDQNAGKDGSCLADAIGNTVYRNDLANFRELFCDALEQKTGIKRQFDLLWEDKEKTKPKMVDGEQAFVWTESEGKYSGRVFATLKVEPSSFQALADEISATLVFDASVKERQPVKPKKTAKVYLDAAAEIIKQGKGALLAQKLAAIVGHAVAEDQESLGKAIAEREAIKRAEEAKKLTGDLSAMVG